MISTGTFSIGTKVPLSEVKWEMQILFQLLKLFKIINLTFNILLTLIMCQGEAEDTRRKPCIHL